MTAHFFTYFDLKNKREKNGRLTSLRSYLLLLLFTLQPSIYLNKPIDLYSQQDPLVLDTSTESAGKFMIRLCMQDKGFTFMEWSFSSLTVRSIRSNSKVHWSKTVNWSKLSDSERSCKSLKRFKLLYVSAALLDFCNMVVKAAFFAHLITCAYIPGHVFSLKIDFTVTGAPCYHN